MDELAAQHEGARGTGGDGTISPDDLSGATFTVSNLGGLGIETFTPLLNPPQVAILGVGAIQPRVVRRQDRDVVRVGHPVRAMASTILSSDSSSLTCDHQIVDGAPGARFLQVVEVQDRKRGVAVSRL